jgi:two-component system NarL family response regulator
MTVRVALIDDHRMWREVLRMALTAVADISVVAEAGTGAEALALAGTTEIDIMLLDIALPDMSGIEVARQLARSCPEIAVLALSGYDDRVFIDEMLKAGALGYVVKSAGADELVAAIRSIAAGHLFLSSEVSSKLFRHQPGAVNGMTPPVTVLGRREQEVLRLIAAGKRSAEIAELLGITTGTVSVHRGNLKKKLGLGSTAELTRYAIREGLHAV